MGRSGTQTDDAVADSYFATLQTELLDRYPWPTRDRLRMAIFERIEVFYNRRRRHQHLGQVSPDAFERRFKDQQAQLRSPTEVGSPPWESSEPGDGIRRAKRFCDVVAQALVRHRLGLPWSFGEHPASH